jgi:hypothetical protein
MHVMPCPSVPPWQGLESTEDQIEPYDTTSILSCHTLPYLFVYSFLMELTVEGSLLFLVNDLDISTPLE